MCDDITAGVYLQHPAAVRAGRPTRMQSCRLLLFQEARYVDEVNRNSSIGIVRIPLMWNSEAFGTSASRRAGFMRYPPRQTEGPYIGIPSSREHP